MKKITFILTFCILFGCIKKEKNVEKETVAIITLLYNKESSKFPPPLPPDPNIHTEDIISVPKIKRTEYGTDKVIYEKKFAIAFTKESLLNSRTFNRLPHVYRELASKPENYISINSLKELKLNDRKGLEIPILYNKTSIRATKEEFNVIGILYYSDIYFNKESTKAIVGFGAYTHGLSGFTTIYCLEKLKGNWKIVFEKQLSES